MCSSALALVAGLALAPAAYAQEAVTRFSVPSQPLASGLLTLGRQARISIAASTDLVGGKSGRAVQGELTLRAALAQMLEGTGLRYEFVAGGAVRIVQGGRAPQTPGAAEPTAGQEASEAEAAVLSEVMVTGTRIRGQAPVGSQIVALDREDLEKSGRATVAEVLKSVPQIQSIGTTEGARGARGQGAVDNTGAGTAINLRGLGSDATLVLVNGRRIAPSAAGAFVDVSQIPMAGVDRVEILPDGASALYGSDAIGGVVNFVLRKHYEGAETSARYGVGDGFEEYTASQVLGKDWGSGSLTLAYEHFFRSNLSGRDRDYYRSDLTRFGGSNFLPQDLADDQAFQSSPGTLVAGGVTYAIPEHQSGQGLTFLDLGPAGSRNEQDPQLYQDILPEQKRDSVVVSLQQQLLPNLRAFADVLYSHRSFTRHIQPATRNLTVLPSNPYFIPGIPGGEDRYEVRYSFSDDFDARTQGDQTNYTVTAGVDFDLPKGWVGEVYVGKGQDLLENVTRGVPNGPRLDVALSGVGLPSGVGLFNPHAAGGNDPATLDFIEGSLASRQSYDIQSINASFSGDLFELPGGTVRMAAGADFRQEKLGVHTIDDAFSMGPTPGTADNGDGTFKRDITAGYAELLVPIFGQANARRGLKKLDLSLAVRSERYSDFGGTTNPKVGLSWKPFDDLTVRGSWSTSFRAPRLVELNEAGNLYRGLALPNAAAEPGDPTTPIPGLSNVVVLIGEGNVQLRPETAESWSFGADYRPSFAPGLKASFTYFTIKYQDRILGPSDPEIFAALASGQINDIVLKRNPTQAELDAIYNSRKFYAFDPKLPASQVLAILSTTSSNYGAVKLDGLDAEISYGFDSKLGYFNAGLSGTYLFRYQLQRMAGEPFVDLLNTSSNPNQFRARGTASWVNGPYRAGLAVNYIGDYENSFDGGKIDPWITADLQLGYVFGQVSGFLKGLTVALDIENLTDEDPPFVNNGNAKIGYDPEAANARGRVISLSLRKTW